MNETKMNEKYFINPKGNLQILHSDIFSAFYTTTNSIRFYLFIYFYSNLALFHAV